MRLTSKAVCGSYYWLVTHSLETWTLSLMLSRCAQLVCVWETRKGNSEIHEYKKTRWSLSTWLPAISISPGVEACPTQSPLSSNIYEIYPPALHGHLGPQSPCPSRRADRYKKEVNKEKGCY